MNASEDRTSDYPTGIKRWWVWRSWFRWFEPHLLAPWHRSWWPALARNLRVRFLPAPKCSYCGERARKTTSGTPSYLVCNCPGLWDAMRPRWVDEEGNEVEVRASTTGGYSMSWEFDGSVNERRFDGEGNTTWEQTLPPQEGEALLGTIAGDWVFPAVREAHARDEWRKARRERVRKLFRA